MFWNLARLPKEGFEGFGGWEGGSRTLQGPQRRFWGGAGRFFGGSCRAPPKRVGEGLLGPCRALLKKVLRLGEQPFPQKHNLRQCRGLKKQKRTPTPRHNKPTTSQTQSETLTITPKPTTQGEHRCAPYVGHRCAPTRVCRAPVRNKPPLSRAPAWGHFVSPVILLAQKDYS